MRDLRAAAVDILTLGQYLRPTPNHLDIERFVAPDEFDRYREWALSLGFFGMRVGAVGALELPRGNRHWRATTPDWTTASLPPRRACADS